MHHLPLGLLLSSVFLLPCGCDGLFGPEEVAQPPQFQGLISSEQPVASGSLNPGPDVTRGQPSSAVQPPAAPPAASPQLSGAAEVNLLRAIQMQVALSSAATSGPSLPGHLVDGQRWTAWRSEEGRLLGEWIAFEIPEGAEVRSLKLSPGPLDADEGRRGERSPRIRKVLVERDDSPLGDFGLDPEDPELQTLPVSGGAGVYKITVADVDGGGRRSKGQLAVAELEIWGAASADLRAPCAAGCEVDPRVGSLRGSSSPRLASKGLSQSSTRAWEGGSLRGLAGFPSEDRAFRRLCQGGWSQPVRPVRLQELSGPYGDRVFLVLFAVDETPHGSSRRRCAPEDEPLCPSLYLGRYSIPAKGVPTLDAELRVAQDVCSVESELDLNDLDGDGRDEVRVEIDSRSHEVCRVGSNHLVSEVIADLDSLHEQYRGDLLIEEGGRCGRRISSTRTVRDVNGDGRGDMAINFELERMSCPGVERALDRRFVDTQYLYDVGHDEWRIVPPQE